MNAEKDKPILVGDKNAGPEFKPSSMPGKNKEKDNLLYAAKKRATLRDGILTLIGNQCNSIGFGCLMVIFILTIYLMSYLCLYQEKKQ